MDVCRFEVAPDCLEEGAGSRPPFLSGLERALSDEMAPCRPPAMAARTVRYAWPLSAGQRWRRLAIFSEWPCPKVLDFRVYFAIIRSALADSFPRTHQDATVKRRCVLSF
jgi:hypothetical protein